MKKIFTMNTQGFSRGKKLVEIGFVLALLFPIFVVESAEATPAGPVSFSSTEFVAPPAKPITTSFTYTSTGIRLAWIVKGIDVESILISSAEDGKDFTEIKNLASTARFLNLMKTDTTGSTKFQVTTTSTKGETFSSTVGLRGRFTI